MAKFLVAKLADDKLSNSLASKLRKRRFLLFRSLFSTVKMPLKIVDIGGRKTIWEREGFCDYAPEEVEILVTNIEACDLEEGQPHSNIKTMVADATDMNQFGDEAFDIVYSNSVIEHLSTYENQSRMADEVQRLGKRYFLQTPNRNFPIEPHFLFPFFQFLPFDLRVWMLTHFPVGWCPKIADRQAAIDLLKTFRLMTKQELLILFPNATLYEEKFLGLTKSFVVYEGWN
ncbi:MAG: class I SAM-dependent methyltransferase [Leptolyngbyaceae cyanobacterium CSU_1_3]|nr:class I SAM-dependent methyltransferase [Leptolyngbyaceae cyanobacterium CSU_1_3]